jgi:hypothetical protein
LELASAGGKVHLVHLDGFGPADDWEWGGKRRRGGRGLSGAGMLCGVGSIRWTHSCKG